MAEIDPVVFEKKITILLHVYLLRTNFNHSTQGRSVPSLVGIGSVVLEKKFTDTQTDDEHQVNGSSAQMS